MQALTVPPSDCCSLLSDFTILLPLQLVHSTGTRSTCLLTPVFKTFRWLFVAHILQPVPFHIANSNRHDLDLGFALHPHSGCAFQVFDFPHCSLARLFYNSMTWLTIPILSRNSSSSVFCIVKFTFMFQPKHHFQNIFPFPSLPLWPHSTL